MFSVSWTPVFVLLAMMSLMWRQYLLFMVSVAILGIELVACGWGRLSLKRLSCGIDVAPLRLFPGERAVLRVAFENRKLLPVTWLQAEIDVPEDLLLRGGTLASHYIPGRKRLNCPCSLRYFERVRREYEINIPRRGYYAFGPVKITCGDPFGFQKETIALPVSSHVVVYPEAVPLQSLGLPSRRPLGDVRVADRFLEDPSSMVGVRDYDPSDSMRRIHWKASARVGRLQVKVFEPRAETSVAVFINGASCDPPWQGSDPGVVDRVVTVGASIFNYCLERRCLTGVFSNGWVSGSGGELRIRPGRAPGLLGEALEGMARLQSASRPFDAFMDTEVPCLPGGCGIVAVTAFVNDRLEASIAGARASGRAVTVILAGAVGRMIDIPGVTVYSVSNVGGVRLERCAG